MTTLDAGQPIDIVSAVREATAKVPPRRRLDGFSLQVASAGERVIAPLLGLYLGYAVVRLPEVFAAFDVPHLPLILMLIFLAMLAVAIPTNAWEMIWERSKALRLVTFLLLLAIGTAELGVWPSESFWFIRVRYFICIGVFLSCLLFLRDRRTMRLAIAIYVLCVTAVSIDVVHTYDPNAVVYDEDGVPIAPEVIAERPELRRLQTVGDGLDSNDFGAILAVTFPLAMWLSVGSFPRRVFWSGAAVLMVMAVVPTQSRGSELGFVAAAVVLVGAGARGWRRWLSAALLAGCAGIFVMMATGIGAAGRFTDFSSNDYNLTDEGRWFFWKQGFVWMLKRPWGYGIDNYPTYFGMLNGKERAAHSTWVQYGMELGVAGITLFVMLCWWLDQESARPSQARRGAHRAGRRGAGRGESGRSHARDDGGGADDGDVPLQRLLPVDVHGARTGRGGDPRFATAGGRTGRRARAAGGGAGRDAAPAPAPLPG